MYVIIRLLNKYLGCFDPFIYFQLIFKKTMAILIENQLHTTSCHSRNFFAPGFKMEDLNMPIGIFIGRTNLFGQGKPSKKAYRTQIG